ncbi:hypothetical protein [Nonomuraea sp. NPDC050310]|uniref:hypothetical protein n=1 Tax=Nonomuraea sp. NPDC050310 TaxID=3154935 RepID=UPI0033C91511
MSRRSHHFFSTGENARVRCYTYAGRTPIFDLTFGSSIVSFSTEEDAALTDNDLAFAKALARTAAEYLAACEQLHAKHA